MQNKLINKPYAVITCSDSNYGDFLINHWLRSLMDNIDLRLVDIVILDYGLSPIQKEELLTNGVKVVDCIRDGHVVIIRFRDLSNFLKDNYYDQILFCDSGDIIFQNNITDYFIQEPDKFRACVEMLPNPFMKLFSMYKNSFSLEFNSELTSLLKDKKIINAGVIFGPRSRFLQMCNIIEKEIKNKNTFGPDQLVVNYFLHKYGFYELDNKLNFIPTVARERFKMINGKLYDQNNVIIPIVHNAGAKSITRPIKNFGYGPQYNKMNYISYIPLKSLFSIILFLTFSKRLIFGS